MIDLEFEQFTAQSAVDAGLIEAVKRGETKITGSYELTADGFLNYEQNNFVFKDKFGNLRCGRFTEIFRDISEITMFSVLFLEEGNAISNECKPTQTFAANISDLLKDSFFLADGFIGEFAAEKIGKIIKKIEGIGREKRKKRKNKEFSIEDCKKEITFIGEPLIRNKLFMMLDEMFLCDGEDYSKLYEECRKRDKNYKLEKLKREKKIIEKKIKELETNK